MGWARPCVGGRVCVALLVLPLLTAKYKKEGRATRAVPIPRVDITHPAIRGVALAGRCPNCLASRGAMSLMNEIDKALRAVTCTPNDQMHRKRMLFIVRPAICRSGIQRTRTRLGATHTGLRCTRGGCAHVRRTVGDSTMDHVRILRTRSGITASRTTIDGTRTTLGATHAGLDCYAIHTPFSNAMDHGLISTKNCMNNDIRPIALTAVCGSSRLCACFGITSGR